MVLILSDAPPAARTPWLPFQGPIPPIRGKCPEETKGVGMLSAKQTERSLQIWHDLSVSAAPSHLPWKGRLWTSASYGFPYEGKALKRKASRVGGFLFYPKYRCRMAASWALVAGAWGFRAPLEPVKIFPPVAHWRAGRA